MDNQIKTAIVVGAGAWGGWTAYWLQKMGVQVTLIDLSGPGNERSGSGGQTRVIRMAYGGNEHYTNLTSRAYELWADCEAGWQEQFYRKTGSLWLFRGIDPAYATLSQPLLKQRGLSLDEIDRNEAATRFPQVDFSDITSVFYEPESGYLEASRATRVVKEQFEKLGGKYLAAKVTALDGEGQINAITTDSGEQLSADAYVLACGPWTSQLVPAMKPLIKVSRQEVYFFETAESHGPEAMPIWIEFREGEHMYYGIPSQDGFKMAYDQRNWSLHPDRDDRGVTPEIFQTMNPILTNRFPAMKGKKLLKHHTCVYESSPDGDFIIDQIPGFNNGWLLCGSSGHGFKMGPAMGEMVASNLVRGLAMPSVFGLGRFQSAKLRKTQYQVGKS